MQQLLALAETAHACCSHMLAFTDGRGRSCHCVTSATSDHQIYLPAQCGAGRLAGANRSKRRLMDEQHVRVLCQDWGSISLLRRPCMLFAKLQVATGVAWRQEMLVSETVIATQQSQQVFVPQCLRLLYLVATVPRSRCRIVEPRSLCTMAGDPPAPAGDGLAERLRAALGAITLDDSDGRRPKANYAFWGTQPVAQFNEQPGSTVRLSRHHDLI